MARRNKLALYYFLSAIGLFALGYGLAWFSEQSLFSREVFPKKSVEVVPMPTPTPTPDTDFQTIRQSSRPTPKASLKSGRQYTVQPGDTISSIAGKEGVDWEELAKLNDIPYPYNVTVGQVLSVPDGRQ